MKKISVNQLTILCIFILFFILNIGISLNGFGDDGSLFLEPLNKNFNGNIFNFLANRYTHWSSRLIIEFFTLLSVQYTIFWKLVNTIAMTAIAIIPVYLFDFKTEKNRLLIVSTGLTLMIPKSMFYETGWIATTTNYLWVLAAYLGFLLIVFAKKRNWISYLFSLLLVMYASNLEQMCVILILTTPAIVCYKYLKKQNFLFLIPHFLITIFNLALISFAPGNSLRFDIEVRDRFPDFNSLTLFRKLELGFSSTLRTLFFDNQLLFFVFVIILFTALYKSKKLPILFVSSFPLVAYLLFNPLKEIMSAKLPIIPKVMESFNNYGTSFNFNHPKTWITDIILLLIIVCILISIIYIFKDEPLQILILLFVLSLAFVTRLIMGFSPTIWASASRTSIFVFYSIGFTSLCILDKNSSIKSLQGIIVAIGFICYLNFII